jgi:hypothetical protein
MNAGRQLALRKFVDADGVEWEVWEVNPEQAEHRLHERRVAVQPISHPDRRGLVDRRGEEQPRAVLPPELVRGWLAFHSGKGKRRYWPIPPDWRSATTEQLSRLCAAARPVGSLDAIAQGALYPPTVSDLTPPAGVEKA